MVLDIDDRLGGDALRLVTVLSFVLFWCVFIIVMLSYLYQFCDAMWCLSAIQMKYPCCVPLLIDSWLNIVLEYIHSEI